MEQPERPFQFSLRTLMILVAIMAVIFSTVPLLSTTGPAGMGKRIETRHWNGDGYDVIYEVVDPEAKWRTVALFIDASLIPLAIWLVARKPK